MNSFCLRIQTFKCRVLLINKRRDTQAAVLITGCCMNTAAANYPRLLRQAASVDLAPFLSVFRLSLKVPQLVAMQAA